MKKWWNIFKGFFKSKTWPKLRWLIGLNALFSSVVTCLIWKFVFQRDFNIDLGRPLEIDFFNTLGVAFTIIGLAIALFQIAELQSEKEIREEATKQANKSHFLNDARREIPLILAQVKDLQVRINNDVYSVEVIHGYINQTNDFENRLLSIKDRQLQLGGDPIIDCENCVTLIGDFRTDLYNAVEGQTLVIFKKSNINSKVVPIIRKLSEFESVLTT
jgi:hypothetical protein